MEHFRTRDEKKRKKSTCHFFGRTDLRKGVSRAKFHGRSDFEVRLAVARPNLDKNVEKQCSRQKIVIEIFSKSKNEMWGIG